MVIKTRGAIALPATVFLDVKGAAAYLNVKPATIYAWVHYQKRTKLPVRKHGRKLAFLEEELKQWSDLSLG